MLSLWMYPPWEVTRFALDTKIVLTTASDSIGPFLLVSEFSNLHGTTVGQKITLAVFNRLPADCGFSAIDIGSLPDHALHGIVMCIGGATVQPQAA
jgi:hypothetical protein